MKTDYQTRINQALASGSLHLPLGSTCSVRVEHDDRCPMLRGGRICKCRPNVIVTTAAGDVELLEDGSVRPYSIAN